MAETAARGVNYDWWNEFLVQASGLGQTFVPAIIGFAGVLDNLSRLADNRAMAPALAGLSVAQAQKAAEIGDGGGALKHLKSAGQWALDVATKVGVSVAAAALKESLKIGA